MLERRTHICTCHQRFYLAVLAIIKQVLACAVNVWIHIPPHTLTHARMQAQEPCNLHNSSLHIILHSLFLCIFHTLSEGSLWTFRSPPLWPKIVFGSG